ncbi:hypothetical protein BT96DRAFT_342512 [Gymnopus androsaceus JB14]|uniref:Uncharacterized protein n=1 Tax=Gymnopus androsaceus JB14 TaxID=1447944 RepID=A0A6A4GXI0_9AGAR|nr:hypothetical protein BT96DRAFT_342512 [Gymnopus androsaceus JB14]
MNANYIVFDSMTQITGFFSAMVVIYNQLTSILPNTTTHCIKKHPSVESINKFGSGSGVHVTVQRVVVSDDSKEGGTTSDYRDDLEMNNYDQKRSFEDVPVSEGYGWGSTTKGKAPQNGAFGASEFGVGEIETLHFDAPPPAFNESQQGSSRLFSAGPPIGSGDKSLVGGMIV